MISDLRGVCQAVRDLAGGCDPDLFSGTDCALGVELLAGAEKCCAGLGALLAARAVACGAFKDRGFSNPAVWLAQTSGKSAGESKAVLDTAERLRDCDATREALLAGEVSMAQAGEITKTEAVAPGAEQDLIDLANRRGLSAVKDEARRRRLAAQDPEEAHRRQRAERQGRTWHDEQAMGHLTASFTTEVSVPVFNRVEGELDRLLRQARKDGSDATVEQLTADAIANLILDSGGKKTRGGGADLVLVCDIAAFQRGYLEGSEICHVIGGGPVPVTVARELAATGAFIKAVLHDGKRVDWVAHFGRYRPAILATALGLGPPPLFPGVVCVDCGRRFGLQWDHADPVANHGPTSYDNLQSLCWPCHQDKTARDRAAGLMTNERNRKPSAGGPSAGGPREERLEPNRPQAPSSPFESLPAEGPHVARQPIDRPGPSKAQVAERPPAAALIYATNLTSPTGETASAPS